MARALLSCKPRGILKIATLVELVRNQVLTPEKRIMILTSSVMITIAQKWSRESKASFEEFSKCTSIHENIVKYKESARADNKTIVKYKEFCTSNRKIIVKYKDSVQAQSKSIIKYNEFCTSDHKIIVKYNEF